MANTSAIRAGRAFVDVFADDSKRVRGLRRAARNYDVKQLVLGGGVSANQCLRRGFLALAADLGLPGALPPLSLCTDNAAMIAAAGHLQTTRRGPDALDFDVYSVMPLDV